MSRSQLTRYISVEVNLQGIDINISVVEGEIWVRVAATSFGLR
jgi:hypothetical protein